MARLRATHQLHLACPTEQLPHSHIPPICLLPFSHLPEHHLPSSAPSDAIPQQLSLARVCFSGLCRPSRPAPNGLAPTYHHHQTLLKAKGMAAFPLQAPWTSTFCVTLGSYCVSGASVSLPCTKRVAMYITDLKYGTSLVSVFSHIAAQSYTLLCACVPTVCSYRAQVLAVLLLCFPCGQMEQGRQMGSWETPQVLTEQ